MKTKRFFESADRYRFDFNYCHYKKGFAQIDTEQDAAHFGTWANPKTLTTVNYCEGDVTIETADTPEEFCNNLRNIKKWNEENGWKFCGIDCMCVPEIEESFTALGLSDLLH